MLVSCVWILDFDELQTETDDGTASGGTSGNGGSSGSDTSGGTSGMGGAGDCPSSCFDDDPCTLDGCTADGECTREPTTGLVLDGVDETLLADFHQRTTIAAGSDAFFLSNLAIDANASEVTFYRLDANAETDALSVIAKVSELELGDAAPLSPAGLAVDTARGLIHAFIGMLTATDEQRVRHIVLDMNYAVRSNLQIADTYWGDSPFHHPVAANLGGEIISAWINGDRAVSLWTGAIAGTEKLALGQSAMTVSLLATPEDDPFALYTVEGGGVFVESPTVAAAAVGECQTRPGSYLSSSSTSIGIPGFWLAFWTKFGEETPEEPGFLTTDGRGLGCSALGCASVLAGDCTNVISNSSRNVAFASALRPGDPTGLVHLVQVTPLVGVNEDTQELSAGIIATASRVNFGTVPFEMPAETTDLGSIVLAEMATSLPGLAGPDWPVVAYVPPDRFAIAWTQPAQAAGSELRIQRYRLCAPD